MKKHLFTTLAAAGMIGLFAGSVFAASALFCVGNTELIPSDELAKGRLEKLGYTVSLLDHNEAASAEPDNYDIIVVSSTVTSGNIVGNEAFLLTAVPTLLWEQGTFDEYQLSTANAYDAVEGVFLIEEPKHPIAAGLKGSVQVYSEAVDMHRGNTEVGTAVALVDGTDHIGIMACDKGEELLDGSAAPGKRAWFAASDNSAALFTDDGWKLFDATIKWLGTK